MPEECSECGGVFEIILFDEDEEIQYCPLCGAELDE